MRDSLTLRAMTPDDEPFLYLLYASTRAEELAPLGWDDAQKEHFLRMQFSAQHKHYTEQFPRAEFRLIELEGEPIGRLYVDRRDDEIRLIDIALVPEHRGAGIGSRLLSDLLGEAKRSGRPIRIHVEKFNRALRLYERLGFARVGDTGVYFLLEWSPPSDIRKGRQSDAGQAGGVGLHSAPRGDVSDPRPI